MKFLKYFNFFKKIRELEQSIANLEFIAMNNYICFWTHMGNEINEIVIINLAKSFCFHDLTPTEVSALMTVSQNIKNRMNSDQIIQAMKDKHNTEGYIQ